MSKAGSQAPQRWELTQILNDERRLPEEESFRQRARATQSPRPLCAVCAGKSVRATRAYSHSIVPGGFEVMSYTTRFTPRTSFTIRFEIVFSTSYGSGTQSAVMPSSECTARMAQV